MTVKTKFGNEVRVLKPVNSVRHVHCRHTDGIERAYHIYDLQRTTVADDIAVLGIEYADKLLSTLSGEIEEALELAATKAEEWGELDRIISNVKTEEWEGD